MLLWLVCSTNSAHVKLSSIRLADVGSDTFTTQLFGERENLECYHGSVAYSVAVTLIDRNETW